MKTVSEILNSSVRFLQERNIAEARRKVVLLLSALLTCKPLELYFHLDRKLDDKRIDAMRRGLRRLAAHEPVQYILGEWDFMEHTFKVDRRALIPRPETEQLVCRVLETDDLWNRPQPPAIVDFGTGCGCIVICLALARPQANYIAVDTSESALELARENAVRHGVTEKTGFTTRDLSDFIEPGMLTALVSNPPYIPTAQYEKLPPDIKDFEPRSALDGGPQGLEVISSLIEDAAIMLADNGYIFLEIDSSQGHAVEEMLVRAGFRDVSIEKDYAGHDRIAVART